jgi:aspartate/tyrosine/aromatic aminotransferase
MRENGIYMPDNGRISLAGINEKNVDHIVRMWSNIIL